jgi:LPS sulfotransferase NodH
MTNTQANNPDWVHLCRLNALKQDISFTRLKQTTNAVKQRRLACAIGANQSHNFACLNL